MSNFPVKIADLSTYTTSMKKTLLDKAFFIDKVEASVFVDFGCADGSLLHFLSNIFPDYQYIGYDISEEMIELAQATTSPNITYFTKLQDLKKYLDTLTGSKCLVLNSVIHEVYSYSSFQEIDEFYEFIFSNMFDYIAIRDMMPNKHIDHASDMNDVARIKTTLANNLIPTQIKHLEEFEYQFGRIEENKNLYHFLLKYKYLKNWEREVRENYFPIYSDEFIKHIPENYCVDYYQEFLLPYLKKQVYNDFQVNLKEPTHLKIIIRKFE